MRELVFHCDKTDLKVDSFCSGGPGGQHQNKTATGCRITHIPSGLVGECRETRSFHQNKKTAWRRLVEKLLEFYVYGPARERDAKNTRLDSVVRTYHEPDNRVTDHDTKCQYSYKQTVGKGNIAEMLEDRWRELSVEGNEP